MKTNYNTKKALQTCFLVLMMITGTNASAQVGIGTTTPQKQLHVNGSLQVTNEISLGGNASTAGTAGTAGQYLKSNGPGAAPTWENLANVVPGSNGTVIAVNGQFLIAQEIILQMSTDFTPSTTAATPIGNLDIEIIDNENRYTGTASTNSFTVSASGVYQVTLNMQISSTANQNPVIGIWDNTAPGNWIARVNDQHVATANYASNGIQTSPFQTYTLITSVNMDAARTYSFRIAVPSIAFTIKATSSGVTGSGPVSQVSLKRLK